MSKRVVVISDVHSNLEALERVLEDVEEESPDLVICCGDVVGYGPRPSECLELVRDVADVVVKGNHDHATVTGDISMFNVAAGIAVEWTRRRLSDEEIEYLASLPETETVEVDGVRVFVVHGSPRDPIWEYVFPETPRGVLKEMVEVAGEPDVLLMGHTHVPMREEVDGTLVANPGSVGQPRDGDPRAAYAVLEVEDGEVRGWEVRRVAYNVDRTAREIMEVGLPEELGARLYRGV